MSRARLFWLRFFSMMKKFATKLWIIFTQDWAKIITVVIAIFLCWHYVDLIDSFITSKLTSRGIKPEDIYDVIDDSWFLNTLLTLGVVCGIVQITLKRIKDRYFSYFKTTVVSIIFILVFLQNNWVFVETIIPYVRYNVLVALGCALYLIITLLRLLSGKKKETKSKEKIISLCADSEGKSKISESREKYATDLVERLLKTDISKEAYALGVSGEWGSGKTLFLNSMEHTIGGRAIIVHFNPWNSKDEKHLIKDLLTTLSAELSPYYSGIVSPISKYMRLLYSFNAQMGSGIVLRYIPAFNEKDISERKEDIEKALDIIGKPVAVFIDDIDRLEGREIFEVLRIIRNTAMFRCVMYIVAYDKEHVVTQLKEASIFNGQDYLEKIFQMEVQIPKPDERMLIEEFKMVCRSMTPFTSSMNSLFSSIKEDEYHQIMKILTSYRKVKRFARQLSFNVSFFLSRFKERNFEMRDLLFINLLEYHNSELYKFLWQNPNAYLRTEIHPNTHLKYYQWPKSKNMSIQWDPQSDFVMKTLFGAVPNANSRGIQYIDLYYKYFYLAQPEKELSLQDFNDMLNKSISAAAKDGMMATIRAWVLSKDNKSPNSIYHRFITYDTLRKDFQECTYYIHAVFYWIEFEEREYNNMKELLPYVLSKARYQGMLQKRITQLANSKVKLFAGKERYLTASSVLSDLYKRLDEGEKLLVDIDEVKKALERNMELFLKSNAWDPICLYRTDGNIMRAVIDANCVPLKSYNGKKKNLVIDQVIVYFSKPENKSNSYVEANDILKNKIPYIIYQNPSSQSLGNLEQTFGDDSGLPSKMLKTCFNGTI